MHHGKQSEQNPALHAGSPQPTEKLEREKVHLLPRDTATSLLHNVLLLLWYKRKTTNGIMDMWIYILLHNLMMFTNKCHFAFIPDMFVIVCQSSETAEMKKLKKEKEVKKSINSGAEMDNKEASVKKSPSAEKEVLTPMTLNSTKPDSHIHSLSIMDFFICFVLFFLQPAVALESHRTSPPNPPKEPQLDAKEQTEHLNGDASKCTADHTHSLI